MIRVALSTSVAQRGKSGVGSYIFGLLDGLRAINAPIQLTLIGLAEDRPLFQKWLDWCDWEEVAERWRPAVLNVWWHQTLLRGVLKKLGADVLHVPSYRRIVWRPPCAQVVTVHDCAAFAVEGKYDAARMFYGRHIVTRLARQANALMAVSQATASDMQRHFGISADEVEVVWNGIDHEVFRPQPGASVPRDLAARFSQARPYFFYLARLEHPGKNHVALIEAFELFSARFPDRCEDLIFAGADWHGAEAIHKRIAASPLRHRIRSLGFLGKGDLPLWYSGATAMVYPSLFEGFGLPPVEAMACGCPVICSPRGSLREIVGQAARFIEPEDIPGIASALGEMTVEARAAWIPRGISQASQFAWEKTAEAVLVNYLDAKSVMLPRAGAWPMLNHNWVQLKRSAQLK